MPTRRAMMLGTVAAGVVMRTGPVFAKASQPATPVNFAMPAGACDCHTHIFGEPEKFPFFAGRVYTPETALPDEMAALHRSLHIERVVIVTPSVYGTDNTATLYGMKARGADARGVAVIDEKTPESELDAMHGAGVRGIRINLATGGISDPAVARSASANRHRPGQGPQLARPDLLGSESHRRAQGSMRAVAGAARVRSFRRRAGRARRHAAGLCRRARSGQKRESLCEDFRRLSRLQGRAGL